jgi:hypothetical protein
MTIASTIAAIFKRKTNRTISFGYGMFQVASCEIEGFPGVVIMPATVMGQVGTPVPIDHLRGEEVRDSVLLRFRDRASADSLIASINEAFSNKEYVMTMTGRFNPPPAS